MPSTENIATAAETGTWEPSLQAASEAQSSLKQALGVEFHLLEVETGRIVHRADHQPIDETGNWAELCREVTRCGQVEFIGEEGPFLVLAIPLGNDTGGNSPDAGLVAVGVFLSRPISRDEDVSQAARLLGFDVAGIGDWASRRTPWPPQSLLGVGRLVLERLADRNRIKSLMEETQSLSENLSSTYEEIALLYRLTQNLQLSKGDQQLGHMALEWLGEVVPAEAAALLLLSVDAGDDNSSQQSRDGRTFLTHGECPVDAVELTRLIDHLKLAPSARPFVANSSVTSADTWPCDKIRQVVAVPLAEGENIFGWLFAINHVDGGKSGGDEVGGGEFGTVEASLLGSVGTILGIHSGNIDLYRQQSEMFSGIVRALTSAIDAKDRYTRGHSDRVAQISVRLAGELGCDNEMLDTIYLAGLLHDIGKIGIDDQVLRKPGRLSSEEYGHIKSHAEVGYGILHGLKQMDNVLPVVLHHHESWDGRGYPHRLLAERIPLSARIVAVADSYDAMSSDRPYRQGMPEERIDGIFREGAGKQWDPRVVAAFFSAREDIREIAHCEQDAAPWAGSQNYSSRSLRPSRESHLPRDGFS